ncbi:acyl-CoA dehydrogenase [Gordonia hydrophobica]|uniref:Acyl-CoA dehydrogenase n=1 Tax=Gordonia hydrophobica TaxID=40516 RepID=A0ABZ2U5F2_9ACTN|nr:acyl-CoA dehydrogenase [Gordonia hydrophobica]MBM7368247.1 alkylation response protein AidB-like acyl-CoA dehydrogenase [Gordonia hydrophobica]
MYRNPVDDYHFLFTEVLGQDVVAEATGGEVSADDIRDVLTSAGEFAVEVLHPLNAIGDREGSKLVDGAVQTPSGYQKAYRGYVEGGWTTITIPEAIGGDGVPWTVHNALSELWSAANAAFSLCTGLSVGAVLAIHASADQQVRDTYLPPMVAGEWTGTMNLTEPQAGTDLSSIRTIARPNGDGTWSVEGQKIFITWGDHDLTENIVHLVLARTPDAPAGLGGLSLFVVPKFLPDAAGKPGARNAITTVSLEHKLGIHSSPTCVLQYEGATGHLIGELHGGLAAMFVMMNASRTGIGLQGLGVADRAYQQARDYADERVQGRVIGRPEGTPISGHPDVARLLLSMSSRVSAIRALSVQLSYWLDVAERKGDAEAATLAEFMVPIFKGWATEESVRIASDGVQVHGGLGFIEETGAAQHLRDARIFPIYEGTTAIQSNDLVGRKVLRNKGETAQQLAALIERDLAPLRDSDHPVAVRTVERMDRALRTAQTATGQLMSHAVRDDLRSAFAVSVPYLELLGILSGGWMHARMLTAALGHAELDDADRRRIDEADFFGAHHLAVVHSLAESIEYGEIG